MTATHHPDEFDIAPVCDFRLLCQQLLKATIPKKWLKDAKAISVDQTAFPTFYRCYDFRTQAEVDRAVSQALQQTGKIPDDVQLGPDGKLIRCADYGARAGRRSASAATGHKATGFVGYQVTFAVLVKVANASPKDTPPGYICGLSVDPASHHPGHAANKAVEDALAIAPGITEVLADMGISQLGEVFVRYMHELGLDVIRDLKSNEAHMEVIEVGTGKNRQHLIAVDGMFFPLWLPDRFQQVPEGLTKEQLQDWYEQRARFRWSRTQRFDNGDMQFRCPQCAGRIVTNLTTHRKNARPNKSAPSTTITHHADECCKGLVTIPIDKLDHWQPTPWGTRAWKASYVRRLQVENVNSMIKADGGLDPKTCRARGLGAHTLAALAAAIAHNLKLAKSDPDADNGTTNSSDDPSDGNAQNDNNPPNDEANTDVPPSRATDNDDNHTPRQPP